MKRASFLHYLGDEAQISYQYLTAPKVLLVHLVDHLTAIAVSLTKVSMIALVLGPILEVADHHCIVATRTARRVSLNELRDVAFIPEREEMCASAIGVAART